MADYRILSDAELTSLIRHGDHAAFTEIYNRHWETLADAAYQRLRSREDAEEVVQEVFVSLYLKRESLEPKSTLEAYLKTALKYKVIDAYRAQQTHYNHLDQLIAQASVYPAGPDQQMDIKALQSRVRQAAAKLPDKCREVFLMSRFQQLSHQEISERTGISVSTVKKHLHKAMSILRQEFGNRQLDLVLVCILLYTTR